MQGDSSIPQIQEPDSNYAISDFRDLNVYKAASETAVEIFELSKQFPAEERFSLVDQIRRSSRSVCANLAEAWRKRMYPAAFQARLTDAEAEAAETQVWLEFAFRCQYLDAAVTTRICLSYDRILGGLVRMRQEPSKWVIQR